MAQNITVNVTVNPSGAIQGTQQVTASVQAMVSRSNASLSQLQNQFSKLDSFIKKATLSVTGFMGAVALADGLKSLLDRLIEVNTMYTQFTATIEAVKGSSEAARNEFEFLLGMSNKLGANVEDMSKSYMRLDAALKHVDDSGESTRHVFEGVATAASVLHLKGYETNRILLAFEQILSKNKVSLEEVQRQLANSLPDAMGMAARAMGMTQVQFREGITKGTINPLELVLKMTKLMQEEYGKAAQKTADSFIGQQNRMKNAIVALYVAVGQNGAMEGLTKIMTALTGMLNNPEIGATLGAALNDVFSQIADWISKITAYDIADFFDAAGGVLKSFVIIMKELIKSFSDTTNAEGDIISFAQSVANGFLTLVEVAHTLVNGILAIPQAIKYAFQSWDVLSKTFSSKNFSFGKGPDAEYQQHQQAIAKSKADLEQTGKTLDILTGKFLQNGLLNGARSQINDVFDGLKQQSIIRRNTPMMPKPEQGSAIMSNGQIAAKVAKNPGQPPKQKKTGRDPDTIFNTESTNLAKAASVAMLEYNNVLNDVLATENKHQIQLEAKMRFDRDYAKLSTTQKERLRDLAKIADEWEAKQKAAMAFQEDKLSMNKAMYQSEQQILDVTEYRNELETKNQREFEEKLKFDVRYKKFTEDMIKTEREKAKALDEQAVKLDQLKKVEDSRYKTRLSELQTERDMANYAKGFGANKYTERDKVVDSIRKGGANFNDTPETKLQLLRDAEKRDMDAKTRDFGQFAFMERENIRAMDEERQMIGKSTWEIKTWTDQKKVADYFRQNGIDLTKEENASLKTLADTLDNDIAAGYDRARQASEDWVNGLRSGLATYADEINNVAKNMEGATTKIFKSMEDHMVSFIMTGKFDFKDFANTVITELVRVAVQMAIMQPLVNMMKGMFGGGGMGDFEAANGLGTAASAATSFFGFAKGGAFHRYASGESFTNKVVDRPTQFMNSQMGERGPEAVMPLTRDAQGRLGVRTQGGSEGVGSINISVNVVNGKDTEVQTDQPQGNDLADKIRAATLKVIHEELRPGGSLSKRS